MPIFGLMAFWTFSKFNIEDRTQWLAINSAPSHSPPSPPPFLFIISLKLIAYTVQTSQNLKVTSLHTISHIQYTKHYKCITVCTVATSGCSKTSMARWIRVPSDGLWFGVRSTRLLLPPNLFIHIHSHPNCKAVKKNSLRARPEWLLNYAISSSVREISKCPILSHHNNVDVTAYSTMHFLTSRRKQWRFWLFFVAVVNFLSSGNEKLL